MVSRTIARRVLRTGFITSTPTRSLRPSTQPRLSKPVPIRSASHVPHQTVRWLSSKSIADEKIEEITELFATARDEFEIAMEETEKVSVYAQDDRDAARVELTKVQDAYKKVVEGPDSELADEVKRRIGQRIRELEAGVQRMEEMATEQD